MAVAVETVPIITEAMEVVRIMEAMEEDHLHHQVTQQVQVLLTLQEWWLQL